MRQDFSKYVPRNQWIKKQDGFGTISNEETFEQMRETHFSGNAEDECNASKSLRHSGHSLPTRLQKLLVGKMEESKSNLHA